MANRKKRSKFGTVRVLPSGRYQARYVGPDGERRTIGTTFPTVKAAGDALTLVHADILEQGKAWLPPGVDLENDKQTRATGGPVGWPVGLKLKGPPRFDKFADEVMQLRRSELAPRTWEGYQSLLTRYLLPEFGTLPLAQVTVHRVDRWWAKMADATGEVNRRNAYFLLSNIMKHAVRYEYAPANPCQVKKASKAVAKPRPYLSIEDFERIVEAAPDALTAPLWTLFGAHVRLGELVGLNRGDVDAESGYITVQRQAQQVRGQGLVLRKTKTGSTRHIKMLAPATAALRVHLADNEDGPDAPLFRGPKGGRLSKNYVSSQWAKACAAVGLSGVHIHDVRHTGLTHVARFASLREVMTRGGHTTAAAALGYQHSTVERDAEVADAASAALAALDRAK